MSVVHSRAAIPNSCGDSPVAHLRLVKKFSELSDRAGTACQTRNARMTRTRMASRTAIVDDTPEKMRSPTRETGFIFDAALVAAESWVGEPLSLTREGRSPGVASL